MYLRMSTEHQQYSMEIQKTAIEAYAKKYGMEIVRTYSDGGKSGLDIEGRTGLQSLIADTQLGGTNFKHILVLDVTRWGRFLDPDESGHYEFICRKAGYQLHYVNEIFSNDGSLQSNILKHLKRGMAGSYSIELSAKVIAGQTRLAKLGFKQGGAPALGLRRVLVGADGKRKMVLKQGERKSLQTDRVILVPGPKKEIRLVQEIFSLFVDEKLGESEIARRLNDLGIPPPTKHPWSSCTISRLLKNEKYIGNLTFNRTSHRLKGKFVRNPESEWVRIDGAFDAIVDPKYFAAAQRIRKDRSTRGSDERMIAELKGLLKRHGKLSHSLINQTPGVHDASTFRKRFGSLPAVYAKAGFKFRRSSDWIDINKKLRDFRITFGMEVIGELQRRGNNAVPLKKCKVIVVNEHIKISCITAKYMLTDAGRIQWSIGYNPPNVDFALLIRMDENHAGPIDFYLIPAMDLPKGHFNLFEDNGLALEAYKFTNLDTLFSLVNGTDIAACQ